MHFNGGGQLEDLRIALSAKIDNDAAILRSKFITLDAGMELVYNEKRREAEAYMADETISQFETPHLTREAETFSTTRFNVAMDIIVNAQRWSEVSSIIDSKRVLAKSKMAVMRTAQQMRDAAEVDWSDVTAYL